MSLILHHIKDEQTRYEQSASAFVRLLEKERDNLERYAESENAKEGYLNKMNFFLGTCHKYRKHAEELLQAISHAAALLDEGEANYYKRKWEQTERENKKLKMWIRQLGKDPELVGFMEAKDFMY